MSNPQFVPKTARPSPSDPYPVTYVGLNGSTYEYARRYGSLGPPVDIPSIATGKIAILGTQTSPSFYKSIDIVVGIASAVTQHTSVHSEPYLVTGTNEINNTRLTRAWHFRADPFTGTVGIGSSFGVQTEFGFSFSNPSLATNSYGFYYGTSSGAGVTVYTGGGVSGDWGVFINDDVSNYFQDLVLIGRPTSIGYISANQPEPILQVRNNNNTSFRQGLYVENCTGLGIRPDTSYRLYVDDNGCLEAARFDGNVTILGTLTKSSGTFDIEHPLEENKRLRHSFIEGPRYDNIYRNKVQLKNGKAKIDLDIDCVSPGGQTMTPGTWEKLNRNPDIFLQNNTGWDRIKGKIEGSILTIECENSESTDLVSWMVVAERCDDFISNSPISDDDGRLILEYDA